MYRAFKSVIDNATLPFKIIVSIDEDDAVTMQSIELLKIKQYGGLKDALSSNDSVEVCIGTSKNKIDAINRDVPQSGWDILVNLSDDQIFTKRGFDEVIAQCGKDEFLHLPDGHVNELLPTMSVMGYDYYKRFNYIYHPDYVSLFCDNEAMDVAKHLNCYKYINEHVFEHLHPAWGKAPIDAQLEHTQSFYRRDERVYIKRRSLGFPIESVY
jgi:hypothetical protein